MIKMKKIILLFALAFIIFPFVSAENIGTYKVETQMQITNFCHTADCTYANLTTIKSPNGTIEYVNDFMTKVENDFNYTYTPTELGIYTFNTCSDPGGIDYCDSDTFEVTNTGQGDLASGSATTLAIALIVMLLVAGLLITLAFKINEGAIIIILFGMAIVILFMATLFSMTLIDNLMGQYENIISGYAAFVMVFKIILSMGVLALTLYAGIRALKMYKMKRGLIDDD